MRAFTLFVLAAVIAPVLVIVAAPENEEVRTTGETWLTLLDNQKHDDSYKEASASFRSMVSLEDWKQSLERYRDPLGPSLSRSVARLDFTKQLRGAPDGNYAIFHFTTNFKNKEHVTERLTLVEEDGRWKVSAYAIH
jgi:Protein of unknown function (DUF4019)